MRQLTQETQEKILAAVENIPEEEQQSYIIKLIMRDFELYCERNLMIKDKVTGAIIPFELNWAQRIFVNMVLKDLADGVPVRYIILKARQLGISTVIEALCYWWTSTHRNISAVIMAHEKEASKNLYEMFRRFYANSHPSFQPTLKYNTKADLTFDVEDEVKTEAVRMGQQVPGLGSKILTLVAKEDTGRSGTNHFFHGSEVAAWEDSSDTVAGVLQTVPLAPNTFAFLESTAKGVGGYFFSEWQSAMKGESPFKPFFLGWWQHHEYELDAGLGRAPYNEFERELLLIFAENNIGEEQGQRKIAWARRKQLEFKTDPKKFFQEYPHTPMAAFLSSGNYAFPVEILMKMLDRANADRTLRYGEVYKDVDRNYQCNFVDHSPLKIWEEPIKKGTRFKGTDGEWYVSESDRKYVIGVDVAEGITVESGGGKEGDYSVIDVMDARTWKTVARWRGHIDPDELGQVAFDIGMYYNGALLGPEINNHGIVTVQKLRDLFYRNLYQRETSEEEQFQERTTKLGWRTDRKTKPLIIKLLAAAIRDGEIDDLDPVFIGEAMTYMINDKGQYDGKANGHDDTVMAKAIGVHLAQWSSYDVDYAKDNIQKANPRIKKHGNKVDQTARERLSAVKSARKSARAKQRRG